MIQWNPTEVFECLGVEPSIEEGGFAYHYHIVKNGLIPMDSDCLWNRTFGSRYFINDFTGDLFNRIQSLTREQWEELSEEEEE
jgi:hypothetical protein